MRKKNKRYIQITSIIFILFVIGLYIYKTNTGTLICTSTSLENDIMLTTEYQATYKNRKVIKVKAVEKITLDDENELENYKTSLNEMYEAYNGLEYYENNISIRGQTLNSVTTINYEKINIDELIKIDSSIRKILDKNNQVSVTKLRKEYRNTGAVCHYKN